MLTDEITAILSSPPAIAAVQAAAKTFVAEVEKALPAADRSTFDALFTAAVNEIASLAHGDPTVAAKFKTNVKTGLVRVSHLFGSVVRDVADAVDPAQSPGSALSAQVRAGAV